MTSDSNLRILFVEDVPSDTELAERILHKDGLLFSSRRVETANEFLKELNEFKPDLIISDYSLPSFDGMQALKLLLEHDKSLPFIVFTGSLNEETAVKCMKEGATDYVLKDRIKRLPFSVREALDKKEALMAKDKAEGSLKESEERLQLAMAVSGQGFWDWDMDTDRAYFSPGWYSMFDYHPGELPETFDTWKSLLHPDDRMFVISRLMESLQNRKTFQMDFRMCSSDGTWIWVTGNGKPFDIDKKGVPHRAIGTCIDITGRKLAEQQMLKARIAAEEANQYKNELLANISHELKTPLSSVIGFSEVLLEGIPGKVNDAQQDYLSIINKSGSRLLELIDKMLDLSMIESGRMDVSYESFSPEYVVSIVLNRTSSLFAKKNICVHSMVDPSLVEIIADADKVTEMLYNIVENSLKFTPEGGKISISVREKGGFVFFAVSDTGIGIEKKDMERIFEPFVQADGSASRKHGGVGLGLMLVREYAKMHNGEIQVESEYGKGSTFTLKLPIAPEHLKQNLQKTAP
ncbi:ATP-binding protein [uncultured Methanolobus sp.]|uniref:sensor histidine kinase n=1 Tax=uncultured Methanolobus sp. TaxID=218300 RepID=UPI002AAC283A|nr:ATP-binding protein [uncultured Methanolobus sp.]